MAEWTQESLEARREELANPIKLYLASGEEAGIWACAVCRRVRPTEGEARGCWTCRPSECEQCGRLSEPRRAFSLCRECRDADLEQREREAMDRAEVVKAEDWLGAVSCNDVFYESVDELLDRLEDTRDMPTRVWAARVVHASIDVDQIVQDAYSHGPDPADHPCGDPEPELMPELEQAVKAWNDAQTWSWWEEDRSRVVVFEGDEAKEQLEAARNGGGE